MRFVVIMIVFFKFIFEIFTICFKEATSKLLCVIFWVFRRRLIIECRRFGTLYLFHLQRLDMKCEILHNSYPAFEDGTDKVFRNVGI